MSNTFTPRSVPSDVIVRWPAMALSLWKRSFRPQAILLMATALLLKIFPAWSTPLGFLLAPSLFVVAFSVVQLADERRTFSWRELADRILPGALRLCQVSLQFAAGFGALAIALASIASAFVRHDAVDAQRAAFADAFRSGPVMTAAPDTLPAEFLHFCATWAHGVIAMMFLGMFIVAIYQGVFGVILHAQEGMDTRASRRYGWQAWQVNACSIEKALREATGAFWLRLAIGAMAIMAAFQTVYLSPAGLLAATYIPCLAYVAYRSIFHGRHENVPAAQRTSVIATGMFAPVTTSQVRNQAC